jgi:hypothetical protein
MDHYQKIMILEKIENEKIFLMRKIEVQNEILQLEKQHSILQTKEKKENSIVLEVEKHRYS